MKHANCLHPEGEQCVFCEIGEARGAAARTLAAIRGEAKPGEMVVNKSGGAQSALHGAPRLIPAEALLRLSQVVAEGAGRYAENNWRRIPFEDHLSHALEHVFLYMDGDRSEDHIGHALCRLGFAVAMEPRQGFDFKEWRPIQREAG